MSRFHFILRRLLVTVPMVLVVVTLTWALIRLAPGSFYEGERKLPPAIEKNIRARYGLDKPWYVQYGKVMGNILRLDFGNSLRYENETVNEILRRTVPVSARSEEHTSELQSRQYLVCRLLLEKKKHN